MSKTTTTIFELIKQEMINKGLNEFVNKVDGITQLTFQSDKFAFIKKINHYDEDVQAIVSTKLFGTFMFDNLDVDLKFKRAFVNRFMDREIGRQTVEAFSSQLVTMTLQNEVRITELFLNLAKYYEGESTSSNAKNDLSGANTGEAQLPQDDVQMDLKADTMNYADTNRITRAFDKSDANTKSNSFNPDAFDKLNQQMEKLFNDFDRKCFLQTW